MRDLRAVDKTDNKLFVYMLNALSDRYNVSAFQLEDKKKKDSSLSKEDIDALDEQINEAEKQVAKLQGERVDILELGGKGDDLGLSDYSRLVYLFHRAGDTRRAADTAIKMLKKFDPQNKNMTMPDDEKNMAAVPRQHAARDLATPTSPRTRAARTSTRSSSTTCTTRPPVRSCPRTIRAARRATS